MPDKTADQPRVINRAAEVNLELSVELGRVRIPLETLLNWTEGSLLELNRPPNGPVEVRVGGRPFARGEVVTVAERFGVRLTEILKT